jgi:hypothetical protein
MNDLFAPFTSGALCISLGFPASFQFDSLVYAKLIQHPTRAFDHQR